MSHFMFTLIFALGLCGLTSAWTFNFPKTVSEGQRLWFDIAGDNSTSYPPYIFQVWARAPYGSASLAAQFTAPPPPSRFDWNNTQPAGRFVLFQLTDAAGHAARSDSFQVAPAWATQTVVQTVIATMLSGETTTLTLATSRSSASVEGGQINPRTNAAVIAGACVGGVLSIAAVAAGVLLYLRRRKPSRSVEKADLDSSHVTVVPFVYDPPQSSRNTQAESEGGPSGSAEPYDAPPSYSPPVATVSPYDSPYASPRPSTSETRTFTDRKGAYVPVSTADH